MGPGMNKPGGHPQLPLSEWGQVFRVSVTQFPTCKKGDDHSTFLGGFVRIRRDDDSEGWIQRLAHRECCLKYRHDTGSSIYS